MLPKEQQKTILEKQTEQLLGINIYLLELDVFRVLYSKFEQEVPFILFDISTRYIYYF